MQKTPIDGLSGLSDEENLGFTYTALDTYIRTGVCEDEEVKAKIDYKELIPYGKSDMDFLETISIISKIHHMKPAVMHSRHSEIALPASSSLWGLLTPMSAPGQAVWIW